MRFKGKVAVVTGGGAGIGRAVSTLLAREGASVVIADLDLPTAEATAAQLESDGAAPVLVVHVEVSDEASIATLAGVVRERYGRVDVLVNNAAARVFGPVDEVDVDSWRFVMDVNLMGPGLVAKHIIPLLREAGGGSIVNVSSANGIVGRAGMAQYDATKAGVLGLTRAMACDHVGDQIRVNAVLPGPTLTDYHLKSAAAAGRVIDPNVTQPHDGGVGIQRRSARPEEIANAIAFLSSDEASYITGAALPVDGGQSAISGRLAG